MTTDILFDSITGNILIKNGELVVDDSTDMHTHDLIQADKGHYKHAPQRGVGVQNYINDVGNLPGLTTAIRSELLADGQDVKLVQATGVGIEVQTGYPA